MFATERVILVKVGMGEVISVVYGFARYFGCKVHGTSTTDTIQILLSLSQQHFPSPFNAIISQMYKTHQNNT